MKQIIFLLMLLSSLVSFAATPEGWFDQLEPARKEARKSKRKLLVLFTGSDWCGWCIKLKKEVLDTPEFKDAAKREFVLLYLDFPNAPLSKEQTQHNREAAAELRYGGGYPGTLLFDADGKSIGKILGFRPLPEYLRQIRGQPDLPRNTPPPAAKNQPAVPKSKIDPALRFQRRLFTLTDGEREKASDPRAYLRSRGVPFEPKECEFVSKGIQVGDSASRLDVIGEWLNGTRIDSRTRVERYLQEVIKQGSANSPNADGGNSLHKICLFSRVEPADLIRLIKAGARVDSVDLAGNTPLHIAALFSQKPDIVRCLLESGAAPDVPNSGGETPLHFAATYGGGDAVKLLLARGAAVNRKTLNDETALQMALHAFSDAESIKHLLDAGASCSFYTRHSRENALHMAARSGDPEKVRLILKTGKFRINSVEFHNRTPLHMTVFTAGESRAEKVAPLLLQSGADASRCDQNKKTPAGLALQRNLRRLAAIISPDSPKPTPQTMPTDPDQLLSWSLVNYDMPRLEQAIAEGAALNNWPQPMPLNNALHQPDGLAFVRCLHSQGLSVNWIGGACGKHTLLEEAAGYGNIAAVRYLLENGADPNRENGAPLRIAAQRGHNAVVLLLLKYGAKPDLTGKHCRTQEDWTALHYAARNEYPAVVRYLLDFKANRHLARQDGAQPVDIALGTAAEQFK